MKRTQLTPYADLVYPDRNDTPYVSFPIFEQFDFIRSGFSTKLGGVSSGIYESMNLGFHRGDLETNVRENYHRICQSIGIKENDLVFTDQVHKANVRVVTRKDCGKGIVKERDYREIDAHITNEPNVPLLVFCADCVPILYVDPIKRAIGATHSGWRGTTQKIGARTVQRMEEEYGCNPEDIIAVIGPCIGKDCYEVSQDVADEFKLSFSRNEWKQILSQVTTSKEQSPKYMLDLWEANRIILKEAGLKEKHIIISELCTMCHQDLFFSHRGTNGQRGSMAGFISMI